MCLKKKTRPQRPDCLLSIAIRDAHERIDQGIQAALCLHLQMRFEPNDPSKWPVDWVWKNAEVHQWFSGVSVAVVEAFRDAADRSNSCGLKWEIISSWHETVMAYANRIRGHVLEIFPDEADLVYDPESIDLARWQELRKQVLQWGNINEYEWHNVLEQEFRVARVRAESSESRKNKLPSPETDLPKPADPLLGYTETEASEVLACLLDSLACRTVSGGSDDSEDVQETPVPTTDDPSTDSNSSATEIAMVLFLWACEETGLNSRKRGVSRLAFDHLLEVDIPNDLPENIKSKFGINRRPSWLGEPAENIEPKLSTFCDYLSTERKRTGTQLYSTAAWVETRSIVDHTKLSDSRQKTGESDTET